MSGTPYPKDEQSDDVLAYLRRNHPEMSDDDLRRLLTGDTGDRRRLALQKRTSGKGRSSSRGLSENRR